MVGISRLISLVFSAGHPDRLSIRIGTMQLSVVAAESDRPQVYVRSDLVLHADFVGFSHGRFTELNPIESGYT